MIKLSKPYIPDSAFKKVVQVLESGNLVQGKYVQEFEFLIKNYLKIKHAVLVSSGTAALHLALIALDIKEKDEIIVPAFTFPATSNVVELVGAKPVFIDIGLDDFCIDVNKIESSITARTKAIIPVHEFGQSSDLTRIVDIAKKYNLYIIEDAACALGTEYNNKKVGTFGDLGCFSLHPRKAITTGEGGIIVTENDKLAYRVKYLRNHGIEYINDKMNFVQAGFNYRLTDFQAAIGIPQLKEIEKIIKYRLQLAKRYDKELDGFEHIKIPVCFSNRRMIYQTYHILIDTNINRDNLINKLKENEIETNYGAQALNCLTFYKNKYGLKEVDFPNAATAYKNGLALPLGYHITEKNIIYICDTLKRIIYANR